MTASILAAVIAAAVGCKDETKAAPPSPESPPIPPRGSVVAELGLHDQETRLFSAKVADLAGNGKKLLVVGGFTTSADGRSSRVPVFEPAGNGGSWRLVAEAAWKDGSDSTIRNVEIADLDGDGKEEIIALGRVGEDGDTCSGELKVLGFASGKLYELDSASWQDGAYSHGYGLAIGDLDGDGKVEIAGGGFSSDGSGERGDIRVWSFRDHKLVVRASTRFGSAESITRVNAVSIADIDGDGRGEIVTGGRSGPIPKGEERRKDRTKRRERGDLIAWRLEGDSITPRGRATWQRGTTTRIRSVVAFDSDGDGAHEVLVAGQCDARGKPCLALMRWSDGELRVHASPELGPEQGEIKDALVMGSGTSLRVVTTGPWGSAPNRQAHVQLWKVTASGLERDRRWISEQGSETRTRALAIWPGERGPELMTVGHAADGDHIVGQLLDWGGQE
jgi:hypothetical protein